METWQLVLALVVAVLVLLFIYSLVAPLPYVWKKVAFPQLAVNPHGEVCVNMMGYDTVTNTWVQANMAKLAKRPVVLTLADGTKVTGTVNRAGINSVSGTWFVYIDSPKGLPSPAPAPLAEKLNPWPGVTGTIAFRAMY